MNNLSSVDDTSDEDNEDLRQQLAQQIGIADGFHDIWGQYHQTSQHTRDRILDSLALNAHPPATLGQLLHNLTNEHWTQALATVQVHRIDTMPLSIAFANLYNDARISLRITGDSQTVLQQQFDCDGLEIIDRKQDAGGFIHRLQVPVEPEPEIGYYQVEILGADGGVRGSGRLIIAPQRCWWPDDDQNGDRFTGVALQLYGLRSQRNWGIGDFTDLFESIRILAPTGVDVIGLNPLHALLPDRPEQRSPYFPSSRYFLNPLYIDPTAIAEYRLLTQQQRDDYQGRARSLAHSQLIDYAAVAALKQDAFDACFNVFITSSDSQIIQARERFAEFEDQRGVRLAQFSQFEARHSSQVQLEARKTRYLQWHGEQQFGRCAALAKDLGMTFGLYTDLAIGSNADGADANNMPELFVRGMEIGAPPDDFSPDGQRWGLPPLSPLALREHCYQPFIDLLRANMRDAGVIRIDHVMGLMHQFWIPKGATGCEGAYVRFPMHDLLAIVALESQRHRCAVVGEDLGTVPDELRHEIDQAGLLATRLLYFEKNWNEDHNFIDPCSYPHQAVVTIGGHDLATLYGYWIGRDLDLLRELGRLGERDHVDQQYLNRSFDRKRLVQLLQRNGFDTPLNPDHPQVDSQQMVELATQVYQLLGRTPCRLLMVQLSDLFAEREQINVPGTIDECPNWQRRLQAPIESWAQRHGLLQTLETIRKERNAGVAAASNTFRQD